MLFNSPVFIFFFLPLTLALFFVAGRFSVRLAAYWLFAASLIFYGWANPAHVPLLLASIGLNFLAGRALVGAADRRVRQTVLVLSIVANLAVLVWYKYATFLLQAAGLGAGWTPPAMPLGISFFTFTQIAFLVDAYRGEAQEYRFGHYGLFVTYFPHLVAGPILHHREMMPQFQDARIYRPAAENFSVGITLFVFGLFKKVILADGIEPHATALFQQASNPVQFGVVEAWLGALAFSFQLYFDFSGYSDMALGLARMCGVRLPLNFDSPYKSASIIDFWRRWHMSLSRFLRDYLYIPLGGGRKGPVRRYVNLLITMVLGGAWHGAGWTFLIWGASHGALLALNHAWRSFRHAVGGQARGRWETALGCLATFVLVTMCWVFFKAESVPAALRILQAMLGYGASSVVGQYSVDACVWIAVCAGIVWGLPNSQQLLAKYSPGIDTYPVDPARQQGSRIEWRPAGSWALLVGAMAVASLMMMGRVRDFLYFSF